MMEFKLLNKRNRRIRLLCLGAHSDDIEIGCGGTILMLQQSVNVEVQWIVLSAIGERGREAEESAKKFLAGVKHREIVLRTFKDGYFPYIGAEIKNYFEELKVTAKPDIVFSHYRSDCHQDHRLVSELARNTFRNHLILEYEVIKYDGDFGAPNMYAHLDAVIARKKSEMVCNNFKSQNNKSWFDKESFMSVMRLRGIESRAPSKYAEAFYCHKSIVAFR